MGLVTGPLAHVVLSGGCACVLLLSCATDAAEGGKLKASIVMGACLHVCVLGRFAFYATGHRLGFGSLQVGGWV